MFGYELQKCLICAAVERLDMHRGVQRSKFQTYKKMIRLKHAKLQSVSPDVELTER